MLNLRSDSWNPFIAHFEGHTRISETPGIISTTQKVLSGTGLPLSNLKTSFSRWVQHWLSLMFRPVLDVRAKVFFHNWAFLSPMQIVVWHHPLRSKGSGVGLGKKLHLGTDNPRWLMTRWPNTWEEHGPLPIWHYNMQDFKDASGKPMALTISGAGHLSFKTQSAALFARRFTAMRCMKFLVVTWNDSTITYLVVWNDHPT